MQVLPISNQDNYKIQFPKFRGGANAVTKPIQTAADSFVRSTKTPVFNTISDIKNYLKNNVDKVKDGEIFNTPITKDGDSLLMAFFHLDPLEEEMDMYESILYKMSKMSKINYDQKDSMDISALEWVVMAESFDELSLLKEAEIKHDPLLFNVYKQIKNSEFKKALLKSGVYTPNQCETEEEQNIIVLSVINKKYSGVSDSVISNIKNSLRNKEGIITRESIVVLKKIVELSSIKDIELLSEAVNVLKDNNGNIDINKSADFLTAYGQKDSSIKDTIKHIGNKYNIDHAEKAANKSNNPILDIFNTLLNANTPAKKTGYHERKQIEHEQQIADEFREAFWSTDYNARYKMADLINKHRETLEKYCPDNLRALGIYPGDKVNISSLLRTLLDA